MAPHTLIELKDDLGLICGFRLNAQQKANPLGWPAVVEILNTPDQPFWLHFNLSDSRARHWIAHCDRIPAAARELLLENDSRAQVEFIEAGFVMVLGDLHYEFDADPDKLGVFRMYVDQTCLISGRRHPLKAIDRLRRNMLDGLLVGSPLALLVYLLKNLTTMFATIIDDQGELVNDIEDLILKGRFQQQRAELGRVRRLLAQLHRHLRGNRYVLRTLVGHLADEGSEADEDLLQREVGRLDTVVQDLELVQERARLSQEEMAGRLEEAVNRNLYVLSIVTTVFLPITLITGVFGMNVGGLLWVETASGFGWVMVVMVMTLALTLGLLRRQRFL